MNKAEALQAMKFYKEKLYNGIFKDKIEAFDVATSALEKQIPKKPTYKHQIGVSATGKIYKGKCCECGHEQKQKEWATQTFCDNCGQALDWSATE